MDDLRHLMSAYFHQDWLLEYDGSWEAAVDDFVRRTPDQVTPAIAQIDAVLAEGYSNEELGRRLYELGNYRHAGDEPDAYASWLSAVAARLHSPGVDGH